MKSIIQILLIVTVTIYYSIVAILKLRFSKNKYVFYPLARKWSQKLLKICKIKCKIVNQQVIENRPYIFVVNHSSLFDIPIFLANVSQNVAIIYKKELEKIPIWGYCLKKSPFVGIVREDAKQSLAGIREAMELMEDGISVLIFPEGTRSVTGELQEFKRGAFLLATQSQVPVVPVAIIGSNEILPKGSLKIKAKNIKLIFHEPILFANLNKLQELELIRRIHSIIHSDLLSQ